MSASVKSFVSAILIQGIFSWWSQYSSVISGNVYFPTQYFTFLIKSFCLKEIFFKLLLICVILISSDKSDPLFKALVTVCRSTTNYGSPLLLLNMPCYNQSVFKFVYLLMWIYGVIMYESGYVWVWNFGTMGKRDKNRIETFEMCCWRIRLLTITRKDRIRNVDSEVLRRKRQYGKIKRKVCAVGLKKFLF